MFQKLFLVVLMGAGLMGGTVRGQLLDSLALDTVKTYYSLSAALAASGPVYRLDLSKQKLKEVPPEIATLKTLNYLNLGKNRLKELPVWFEGLTNLQELVLSKNRFQVLDPPLFKLTNLRKLAVAQNSLTAFPEDIGRLTKLEVIDAWSNELYIFPEQMRFLRNLDTLDLRGILLSENEQTALRELIPNAVILMDTPCNCKF